MAETETNVITGTPLGGVPTVDAETGLQTVNVITGTPLQTPTSLSNRSRMGTQKDPLQGIMGGERYKNLGKQTVDDYTKYGVTLGRNLDWRNTRAQNQSTGEQWAHGLAGAAVTTVGAVAENTLGVLFGLWEVEYGSGDYFDNAVGKNIDKANKWMTENMPNYLTNEEQSMGTLQKMGTANFWADTVAGGLGYTVGSLATMYLTGGLGIIGMGAKAAQLTSKGLGLYNASKAIVTGAKLGGQLTKGAAATSRFVRAGQMMDAALMMSLGESSVEARETKNSVYNDLIQDYVDKNRVKKSEIPADVLRDIEDTASSAGNSNFLTNLVITSGTNALMFGKMVSGYRAAANPLKDAIYDTASKKAASKLAGNSLFRKSIDKIIIPNVHLIKVIVYSLQIL